MKKYLSKTVILFVLFIFLTNICIGMKTNISKENYNSCRNNIIYYSNYNIDDIGWYTSLALDSYNNPHISYYDYTNGNLKHAYFTGDIWSIETIDVNGNVGKYTSIAIDNDNNPHISYYDDTNGDLKYAEKTNNIWTLENVDTEGKTGMYTSLVLDDNGFPHISYIDYDNRVLKYSKKIDNNWETVTIDDTGQIGVFEYFSDTTSIALDSQGNPHISYCEFSNYDLKYAYWTGSNWIKELVDSEYEVGQYSSLLIDEHDNPHISYGYLTRDNYASIFDLKYAVKKEGTWNLETVEGVGDFRKWVSLKLDSNNTPHMSYYDYYEGSLKYSYKDGEDWIIETVESDGSTGCFNSLYLDSNDNPYISYYDWGNKALKYAQKTNSTWNIEIIEIDTNSDYIDQEQKYCSGYAYLIDDSNPLAQSFIPTYQILTRVELMTVKRYNPGGMTVSIKEELTGDTLTSIYLSAEMIGEDLSWKNYDFPDIEVTPGNTYYIVCTTTDINNYDAFYWYFGINDEYVNGNGWIKKWDWQEFIIPGFPDIDFGFKTFGLNTYIPTIPEISGPIHSKVGEECEYKFISDDGDNDDIYYCIDWGDGKNVTVGPNPSGTVTIISHKWDKKGSYTMKAKAIDINGAESDWGYLTINVPKITRYLSPRITDFYHQFSKFFSLIKF